MRKRIGTLLAVTLVGSLTGAGFGTRLDASADVAVAAPAASETKDLRLWYDEPAPDSDDGWIDRSIPMGNGYLGANLFGGTGTERIQITENSTQDSNDTIGGLNNFAEVYLDFGHDEVTDYTRELVMDEGVARVRYEHDGVGYRREVFTSYPDKVMAVRLSADTDEALSFTLRPTIPYLTEYREEPGDHRGKSGTVVADGDTVTLSGVMEYYNLQFEGQFKVVPDGGTMQASNDANGGNGTITVTGADSAVILIAVGTNYQLDSQVISAGNRLDKLKGFPHPHAKVSTYLADAAAKSYDELLAAHQADYLELYDRVDFDLGGLEPAVPTDELVDAYRAGDYDPYLEELVFQFGRYLLISSSRAGALPPNLQGVWNVYQDPPWRSGYWHNVNLQMNYWPAFPTNLPELFDSYVGYYNAYLPRQRQYATQYVGQYNPSRLDPGGDNGWSMGNSTWPYNGSGKSSHSGFGTGAWIASLFWDYYDYTRDEEVLADVVYPAMRGQANFLSRFVRSHDGYLLANPSASPENAGSLQTIGTTFDQQMIYENHRNTIRAAEVLGRSDSVIDKLREQLPLLDPIVVGRSGQIKEYREEQFYGDVGDPRHRHISHLLGVYPGQLVDTTTPAWLDAAKVSLEGRGQVGGTGWAQAERIGTWARLQDGEQAYFFYNYLLRRHSMHNLFNNHRDSYTTKLFQVDGNFGATAGVSEMLLQSNEYVVAPLPALPGAWSDGGYRGLLARGNFEVSAQWSGGRADRFEIRSNSGGTLKLRYADVADAVVRTSGGDDVSFTEENRDQISFDTIEGETYAVTGIPAATSIDAPAEVSVDVNLPDLVKLEWAGSDDAASYNVYRAVGSAPDYEPIASGVDETSLVYESADLVGLDQVTFRVTAVAADGRESGGATTVRLEPDDVTQALRIDGDVLVVGEGDGEVDDVPAADGAYTVGMTWRSSMLTEVRLTATEFGRATLRSDMFTTPVRVYRADGRPAGHSVDGDVLTLPTRAGASYRIVAQAVVTAAAPPGTQTPRSSVPVSVTLDAADHRILPATRATLEGPGGWAVAPESVALSPVRPHASATAEFVVEVPAGTPDGRYRLTAVVASDEWSVRVPLVIEVLWPNVALGKPVTQSSLGSGGVPERGVDGDTNGSWSGGSVTHTDFQDQPWWQVDLEETQQVEEIAIWGRTDGCCVNRLTDYYVLVSDEPFVSGSLAEVLAQPGVWSSHQAGPPTPQTRIEVGATGRYVRVQLAGNNALSLAEVQVFPGVRPPRE